MPYNVLIVEDQEMPKQLFEIFVNSSENYVHVASLSDASLAPTVCRTRKVDLVLMDVCTAQNSSGLDAAEQIKKEVPSVKIIIVTSMPEFSWIKRARDIDELDLWKDKSFEEVGIEALKAKSEEKEKAGKVEQEKSTEYIRPSELVAAEVAAKALPVSMDGRGLESLTRMSDRETLSRAETYYGKDGKFSDLYHGKNVLKSEEESEYGLMVRLAMFCGGDQDRLLRVFRSSGQYREEKPNAYYEKMAENSLKFISDTKRSFAPMGEQSGFSKGKVGINSKR